MEHKKHSKRKLIAYIALFIVIALIGKLILAFLLDLPLFRMPDSYYMQHIDLIEFEDNVKIMKRQVTATDVYGTHILAEEIIETSMSWSEVRELVASSPKGDHIHVFPLDFKEDGTPIMLEWDDYHLNGRDIEGKVKPDMNYYLLNEHTPYGQGQWICLWE